MTTTIPRAESSSGYQVRHVRLPELSSASLAAWKARNVQYNNDILHCDPELLQEQFKDQEDKLHVFVVERGGELIGAVPFDLTQRPLKCQLGEFQLIEFPLRRLRLLGYSLSLPADSWLYDLLFRKVLEIAKEFDAIFMEYVSTDSFLSNYLRTSPLIRKHFHYFDGQGPLPHPLVRFSGSFDEYLRKFSAKTRKNRLRELKKLQDKGKVDLLRVTEAHEIDAFLDTAAEISRKTWQFHMLGWGLAAWDLPQIRRRMRFAADKGWLRSYLLKCDGTPCSFILGYQHSGRFYHAVVGFDPEWGSLSAGSVLQFLVLEDLFNLNTPDLYDFGTYAPYKQHWSNEDYLQVSVILFRRRPYPVLAEAVYRGCRTTSIRGAALLDRLHLKPAVRHLLRRIRG